MGKEREKERRKRMRNNAELSLGAARGDREKILPSGNSQLPYMGVRQKIDKVFCVNCLQR